jgi:hypothetical protein
VLARSLSLSLRILDVAAVVVVGARWWRCPDGEEGRPRWWWWKGKGWPRWRWWKRKGLVRCAVVVVEGAVRWRRRLEVGDDPDRWGPPARERERRERE